MLSKSIPLDIARRFNYIHDHDPMKAKLEGEYRGIPGRPNYMVNPIDTVNGRPYFIL